MRIAFALLLFANLAWYGWTHWVAPSSEPAATAAAAGIAPGLAWFWARLTDNPRLNIYRTCWGVPVGAGFVFFLFMEGVLPLLEEVFEIFAG